MTLSWTQAVAALVEEARGRSSASGTPTLTVTLVPASALSASEAAAARRTRETAGAKLEHIGGVHRAPLNHIYNYNDSYDVQTKYHN